MARRILATLLVLVALVRPGWAQTDVSAADEAAIRDVISRQIEAFRHDDAAAAFAAASPGIQERFGDPSQFLRMVQRAYPSVYRPRSVDFAELLVGNGTVVQQVELLGPDGDPELALYSMERDAAGQWKISGCTLMRSTHSGA